MPRGGARPGAGRKPKPKAGEAVTQQRAKASGYTNADGRKADDAPAGWPFGTQPPAPAPAPTAPVGEDGEPVIAGGEPLEFLQAVINETRLKLSVRMQAAAIAVGFKHAKPAPLGKKETKKAEAAKVAGRFSAGAPPKLVAAGGKKV